MFQPTEPRAQRFFRAFRVFRGPTYDFVPFVSFMATAPRPSPLASRAIGARNQPADAFNRGAGHGCDA